MFEVVFVYCLVSLIVRSFMAIEYYSPWRKYIRCNAKTPLQRAFAVLVMFPIIGEYAADLIKHNTSLALRMPVDQTFRMTDAIKAFNLTLESLNNGG